MAKEQVRDRITGWILGLAIAVVVPIGAASFFIGQLSSKTSSLERIIEGHYTTVRSDTAALKQDLATLRVEIRAIEVDIRALRTDVVDFIQVIQELPSRQPNE